MPTHILFIGTDCPHCDAMRPLLAKLVHETGIEVAEYDIWDNESYYRMFENFQAEIGDPECDGIPFFYNTNNKKYLCGEVSYKQLKEWATV